MLTLHILELLDGFWPNVVLFWGQSTSFGHNVIWYVPVQQNRYFYADKIEILSVFLPILQNTK
jgi:hypothetical protein